MHETSSKRPRLSHSSHDLDDPRDHRPPPGLALDPPDEPPPSHPPEIPVERLDPDALKVIARLRHLRHQAYLVGGCVRDLLLDRMPKDFDVATDAHPGEVRAIFRNCRLIGRRFRLAHVYFRGGKVIEVATFRKNPIDVAEDVPDGGDLLITRDNVFGTAEEDAVRRDFTVNGLFYDVARGEVIDYVGGREDLESHRIATIGDPEIRIREDPVRALRAVRFAARLGFIIAPDTFEAMRRHAGELSRCAPARVLEETFKILRCGGSARAFELLRACGALPVVLPALASGLDRWDEPRRRSFFAHLAALDQLVRSGEEVSDAVLLGALLMHLQGGGTLGPPSASRGGPRAPPNPPLAPGQPHPAAPPLATSSEPRNGRDEGAPPRPPLAPGRHGDEADAFLALLVATSRLPRKVAERTRLALHAHRTFRDPSRRRRRRGRIGGQPHLTDSTQLLRISVQATGEGHEILDRIAAAGEEPPPRVHGSSEPREDGPGGPAEGAAQAAEGQPGGRRRRRRRGGRRRRRRGPGSDAPAGDAPSRA
jgi:poly(A) polymerase